MQQTASQAMAYWDLIPAIVGGIIGAFAGGIPSWLLARRQSNESLRRDREQRLERQKALAFSSAVKLITITNSIIGLYNHVKSCLASRTIPEYAHMDPWQVVIPMIGFSDEYETRFSPDEMAVLAAADEASLMQDMMLLAQRHASSITVFQEYCKCRDEFRSIGPAPSSFIGEIGSANLTQEEINKYMPYTIPMNSMISSLNHRLDEDIALSRSVVERFGPATKAYFKVDKFVDLTFPSDKELAPYSQPALKPAQR